MKQRGQHIGPASEQSAQGATGRQHDSHDNEWAVAAMIRDSVTENVRFFLGNDHPDTDDVIQESIVAVTAYVRDRGRFSGDLLAFAAVVARNRCRSLLSLRRMNAHFPFDDDQDQLVDGRPSPLDICEREDTRRIIRLALVQLDDRCRHLLEDLYIRNVPVAELRNRLGLGSVQAVYHRRNVCLEKIAQILNGQFFGNAWSDSSALVRDEEQTGAGIQDPHRRP